MPPLIHYVLAPLITAVTTFILGAFAYLKDKKRQLNRIFALYCFSIASWSFWQALLFKSQSLESKMPALFYAHLLHLSAFFIPTFFLHFIFIFLGEVKQKENFIKLLYIISISSVLFNPTRLIIRDMIPRCSFPYIVDPGILYFFYNLFFLLCVIYGLYKLFKSFRESSGYKRNQAKYLLLGSILGYVGASQNFSYVFGIRAYPLNPFGTYAVPVYVFIVAYTIIRYRLMDIETVIHRTLLWVLTLVLAILPMSLVVAVFMHWIINITLAAKLALISTILIFFVWYYNKLKLRIDHFFRRRKYDYQTILGKVAEKIAATIKIEELTQHLLTEVCEAMYLRNSFLYITSKDEKNYFLIGRWGYKEVDGIREHFRLVIYTEEEKAKLPEAQREIDCDTALCKWIIQHRDILEKEQIEIDPQYENIRQETLLWFKEQEAELVVPLVFEDRVTALLGLGKKENLQAYTLKDLQLLKKLGREAGVTVFNALHHEDLLEKERLEDELKLGREIQMALLPRENPRVSALTVQGLMQPAKEIGGDYYDFIPLPNKENLAIVIGDVSGKGVSAGLIMSLTKATIHTLSEEGFSPREILLRTNRFLNKHIGGQKFMTLLYLLWQPQSKSFVYSSAGHEHILLYRNQSQSLETIQSGGFMLGMIQDIDRFLEEKQISINPQDKILLYTDGVTEAEDSSGDRFGLERLKDIFIKHSSKPATELIQAIKDEVYAFIGIHPQYDDITLVVMEAT